MAHEIREGAARGAAEAEEQQTADVVPLAVDDGGDVHVLLVRRDCPPFEGHWALPGGYRDEGETSAEAGARELLEEAGVEVPAGDLREVGVYAEPGRDPRGRFSTTAYVVVLAGLVVPEAGSDAREAVWWPVGGLPSLAFDHHRILGDAVLASGV